MNNRTNISAKTRKMTLTAILAAIVIVLQLVSIIFSNLGANLPSLVLIPIVIAGILVGAKNATFIGIIFGVLAFVFSITGFDKVGSVMAWANPAATAVLCVLKGGAAALVSGVIYKFFKPSKTNNAINAILPAIAAPIVNTAIYVIGVAIFFKPTLVKIGWNGSNNIIIFIVALIIWNFVFEFALNVVVCPILASRIKINKNI